MVSCNFLSTLTKIGLIVSSVSKKCYELVGMGPVIMEAGADATYTDEL